MMNIDTTEELLLIRCKVESILQRMSALDQSSSLLERLRQVPQRNLLEGALHAVLIELGAAAYDRLGVATSAQTVINSEADKPHD